MTATHLAHLFTEEELQSAIDGGYVSVQTHPSLPLVIYNYSPAAQYERMWNHVTTQCRGLIADLDGYIVARPFSKFFNYGETDQYDELPEGDPVVSEKMDGSLGIIYSYKSDTVHHTAVATRGSFASDQARWASDWLWTNLPDFVQPEGVTTLVEIIYPQNRIVVDYGSRAELVLLGAILNSTGQDIDANKIDWWDGSVAEAYPYFTGDADDIAREVRGEVGHDTWQDGEGVVLCWSRDKAPSFRLKVKHPRYVELHRIVTGLSTRTVHEAMSNGTMVELVDNVPDEFHPWLRQVIDDLRSQFDAIYQRASSELMHARYDAGPFYDRRDLAEKVKSTTYPGLCFALEDGKDIAPRIWSMIVPEQTTAMIIDTDNGDTDA